MATEPETVQRVIARLREVAPEPDQARLDALDQRVAAHRLRVLVVGEAKRGKSTLVNRLVGRDVVPTGVLPLTAVATTVRAGIGGDDHVRATYTDGREQLLPLEHLEGLVTERRNPGNALGLTSVEVVLASGRLLQHPVELVDTPGTGSVFEHNTQAAVAEYASLDAVIVVVAADPPISAAERDLLQRVAALAVRTFVVLNKSDQLDQVELVEAVRFTESVCASLGIPSSSVQAVSARRADEGFVQFRDTFDDYLANRASVDASEGLRRHTLRIVAGLRDEAEVELRAIGLMHADDQSKVQAFADRVRSTSAAAVDLDDAARVVERRLRRQLDDSAAVLLAELTSACRQLATVAVDGSGGASTVEQLHEKLRRRVTTTIGEHVDAWRLEQAQKLEAGLTHLVEATESARARQLGDLQQATRDLLGLSLMSEPAPLQLQEGRPFWYAFDPPIVWEVPGTQTLRRIAPRRRRRATAALLAETPQLVDRQVGRARAQLQERLAETTRMLLGQLRTQHHDVLARLQAALAEAVLTFDAGTQERSRRHQELQHRLRVLQAARAALAHGNTSVAPTI